MNTLREMARFVGMGPPICLRAIGDYVTNHGESICMHTVIQRLESLPPITLEAEARGTEGEVPLRVEVHVQPSIGLQLEERAHLYRATGQEVDSWITSSAQWTGRTIQEPGAYSLVVTRTGVVSTGRTQLTKSFAVTARPKAPAPGPVLPTGKPSLAVKANGDGSFVVRGSGFVPNATVHIRIVDDTLTTLWCEHSADATGALEYPTGQVCQLPGLLHFSANDGRSDQHDLTGVLWSNTVTATC
jgi:hypothetical protein